MVLFLLTLSLFSPASSCCGQTPSSFPIYYQQESLSLSTSLSQTSSLGRVYDDSNSFFLWSNDKKRTLSQLQASIGSVALERHQFFLSGSVLRGQWKDPTTTATAHHLSDIQLGYSYEAWPEYSYSPWKPVIFVSLLMNLPTGKSIYDSNSLTEGADVTGSNQWGTGIGLTARKVYFPITLLAQTKWIRLFAKEFARADVSSSNDFSTSFFTTYSLRDWNLNLTGGISWSYLSSREIKNLNIASRPTEVNTLLISLQKILSAKYAVGLSYADQSWIGRPRNTLINQTYSIYLNYNTH